MAVRGYYSACDRLVVIMPAKPKGEGRALWWHTVEHELPDGKLCTGSRL